MNEEGGKNYDSTHGSTSADALVHMQNLKGSGISSGNVRQNEEATAHAKKPNAASNSQK